MPITGWVVSLVLVANVTGADGGLADPTRPVDYVSAAARQEPLPDELVDWRLTAVRIGGSDSSAVLNGRIVRAGDQVGRARILEVKSGAVLVEYDRRQVEVRLFRGIGKQKVRQDGPTKTE